LAISDKSKSDTISRIFIFDRDTDIGRIQIGDRYHACVVSDDLSPPEGQECEKRVVKHFDNLTRCLLGDIGIHQSSKIFINLFF